MIPAFVTVRRQHIIDLVLHGMRGRLNSVVSTPNRSEAS